MAVDTLGYMYAAGYIGKGTADFRDGNTATGVLDTVINVVLVKC